MCTSTIGSYLPRRLATRRQPLSFLWLVALLLAGAMSASAWVWSDFDDFESPTLTTAKWTATTTIGGTKPVQADGKVIFTDAADGDYRPVSKLVCRATPIIGIGATFHANQGRGAGVQTDLVGGSSVAFGFDDSGMVNFMFAKGTDNQVVSVDAGILLSTPVNDLQVGIVVISDAIEFYLDDRHVATYPDDFASPMFAGPFTPRTFSLAAYAQDDPLSFTADDAQVVWKPTTPVINTLKSTGFTDLTYDFDAKITGVPVAWYAQEGVITLPANEIPWNYSMSAALPSEIFSFTQDLSATAGTHKVSLIVKNNEDMVSKVKTVSVRIAAPSVRSARFNGMLGLNASFSVTASAGVDQYTIVDGDLDLETAVWKDIVTEAAVGDVSFNANTNLEPVVGTHKVRLAVRNSVVGIPSSIKTVSVPLNGPKVTALRKNAQNSAYCQFALTHTGGATHYAVMEGDWDPESAAWWEIPAAAADSFNFNFQLQHTVGNHKVTVALKSEPLGGLVSAPKSLNVRLAAPLIKKAKLNNLSGLTATFDVTTNEGVDQYAIVDGTLDLGSADWQDITLASFIALHSTFQVQVDLEPVVGTHKVQLAVRRSDMNLPSTVKTVSVPLNGPKVTAIRKNAQNSAYCQFAVTHSGGATHYAVMEGDWDPGAAAWWEIPAAAADSFNFNFQLQHTVGNHKVTVALKNEALGGLVSAPKSINVRLAAPRIRTAKLNDLSGLTATFDVTTSEDVNQYAIVDGTLDLESADWQDIVFATVINLGSSFQVQIALEPTVGTHKVQLAVRRSDMNLPSAVRTIPVVLKGPKVSSIRRKSQASNDCTFTLTHDGSGTHYAVMEGTWDVESAVWQPIPLTAATSSFDFDFAVENTVGRHTVTVAVKNDALGGLVSAPKSVSVNVTVPSITRLTPSTGTNATEVQVVGRAFGSPEGTVRFGGEVATVASWSDTLIVCTAPLLDTGSVLVTVETHGGLVSAGRAFNYLPPWPGSWTGTFAVISATGTAGSDYSGYSIMKLASRAGGGVSISIAGQPDFVGELDGLEITASGLDRNGNEMDMQFTYDPADDEIVGELTITDGPLAAVTTVFVQFNRPETVTGTLSGVFVILPTDVYDSENPEVVNYEPVVIAQFTQTGEKLTIYDKLWQDTMTGTIVGDVFVLDKGDGLVTGRITEIEGGKAIELQGSYDWFDEWGNGWGTIMGYRAGLTSGLSNGTTNWTINVDSDTDGVFQVSAVMTITGTSATLVITDAEGPFTVTGFVYDTPVGPCFALMDAAREVYISGFIGDGTLDGAYTDDSGEDFSEGLLTGTLDE